MMEMLKTSNEYLLFACFHLSWIDVCSLEVGEEELNRGCVVAVRPSKDAGHIVFLQELQSVPAPVVGRVVHENDVSAPPPRLFAIQELDQVT